MKWGLKIGTIHFSRFQPTLPVALGFSPGRSEHAKIRPKTMHNRAQRHATRQQRRTQSAVQA